MNADKEPDKICCFCSKTERQVDQMLASTNPPGKNFICGGCIESSMAVILAHKHNLRLVK